MATLVLGAVGTLVGGPIGGAIGAIIGQSADQLLFAPKAREGARLSDLKVQTSSYGTPIPKVFGIMRVAGTVIWSTDLIERRATSGGGKGRPKTAEYSYAASFAVALSGRPVVAVQRIWADGKLLRGAAGDFKVRGGFRLHTGDEDQAPDPLIVAAEGAGQAPAFRGVAYAMLEELELAEFGNRIPSLTFEVLADAKPVRIGSIAAELSGGAVAEGGTQAVAGFAAGGDSVRAVMGDLADIMPLSLVDDGSTLVLGEPEAAAMPLARARLAERHEVVRRAAATVPGEVSIAYFDVGRDYQIGLQRAASGGPVAEARSERRVLPAVLSASEAKGLAERRLDALWAGRETAAVTLGWRDAAVRPGAVVALEGEGGRWRVERRTLGAMTAKLDLVRLASGTAAAPPSASAGRATSEADLPHGPTVLRLVELPIAESLADRPVAAVLAAGTLPGWRRASLSASFDGGASWVEIGATAAPAVMGAALTALAPAGGALFDGAGRVEVALLHAHMELLSRDEDALAGGANLALLGGELIQFGRAEEIAPGRWRLAHLLRGRRGTEWAIGLHAAGEGFALIERGSLAAVELPTGGGAGASLRVLASGVADVEAAQAELVLTGEAVRPPTPVHLRVQAVPEGYQVSWVRRSRLGWSWVSGADTPLGEEAERYLLTLTGAGFVRSVELSTPSYLYTAAQRAADGAGAVGVEVVQLGTHAASRPAAITIS